ISMSPANSRSMYSTARRIAPTSNPGGSATEESKSSFRAISVGSVQFEFSEFWNGFHGKGEVFRVYFHTDTTQVTGGSGGNCRTRSHKRIQDDSLAKRQGGPRQLPEEILGLQRRLSGNLPLKASGWRRGNQILEWLL